MSDVFMGLAKTLIGMIVEACQPNADLFYLTKDAAQWASLTSGAVATIYDFLRIIGMGLTIIYFIIEMNQKLALEGRDLNMKSAFAPFLKLMIAIAAIQYSGKIVSWILRLNDLFIEKVAVTNEINTAGFEQAIRDSVKGAGFFLLAFAMLLLLIMMVVSIVLKLVWMYKAVMYKLELLFKLALLPIAVSDVYQGANSSAIKYLKGFFVLGIVGASCVALPGLAINIAMTNVARGDVWTAVAGLGQLLVAPFAAIAGTSVAKQLAKEALNC